jgi:hypothetical protein
MSALPAGAVAIVPIHRGLRSAHGNLRAARANSRPIRALAFRLALVVALSLGVATSTDHFRRRRCRQRWLLAAKFAQFEDALQANGADYRLGGMVHHAAGLSLQLLLLLPPHDALRSLIQLVFRERHGELQQELLVDGLEIVEGHSVGVDYGIQDLVERVEVLLQSELVEELGEAER